MNLLVFGGCGRHNQTASLKIETSGIELCRQISIIRARHVNDYRRVVGNEGPIKGSAFPRAKVVAQEDRLWKPIYDLSAESVPMRPLQMPP